MVKIQESRLLQKETTRRPSQFSPVLFSFHNGIALLITASDSFTGGPLMEI